MRSFIAVSLVLASSCSAAWAQDSQPNAVELVKAGEAAAAKRDWATAKDRFVEATMVDGKNVLAFYDLGVALAHLGDLAGGAEAERKALVLDKGNVPACIELGVIQCQQRDYDGAIASLQKALQLDPDNMSAQRNLQAATAAKMNAASEQRRAKPVKSVTADSETGISKEGFQISSAPAVKLPAAVKAADAGATAGDLPVKQKAPRAVAPSVATLLDTGIAAFKKGEYDSARKLFEEAIAAQPNNPHAHANLGVVLGTMGSPDQQIIEEKRAVQLDPKYVAAWVNLGWAESQRERWGDALIAYQRALALDANQPEALCGQALALFREGKEEAGIAAIKLAARSMQDPTQAKIALAEMLQAQSRYHEAEDELREALKLSPNNAEAKKYLATVSKLASKDDSTK